jgi:hypothetical protein
MCRRNVASLLEDGAHFITMVTIAFEPPMPELHTRPRAPSAMKRTSISVCGAGSYCQSAAISQENEPRRRLPRKQATPIAPASVIAALAPTATDMWFCDRVHALALPILYIATAAKFPFLR